MLPKGYPQRPILQLGFVPPDHQACLRYWIEQMRVGPFFEFLSLPFSNLTYKGSRISIEVDAYIAYWGDVQIEIVAQRDKTITSFYTDYAGTSLSDLNHVAVATKDYQDERSHWLASGATEVMAGTCDGMADFSFFDLGAGGPCVEIADLTDEQYKLFDWLKEQASQWDGTDPIRALPTQ